MLRRCDAANVGGVKVPFAACQRSRLGADRGGNSFCKCGDPKQPADLHLLLKRDVAGGKYDTRKNIAANDSQARAARYEGGNGSGHIKRVVHVAAAREPRDSIRQLGTAAENGLC